MKTQLRIPKISIEVPRMGDEIWVHLTVQKVEWDDEKINVLNIIPRSNFVHDTASNTAGQVTTIYDPILKKEITFSGYGLHLGLEKMCMALVNEKCGGEFDEAGKLWLS